MPRFFGTSHNPPFRLAYVGLLVGLLPIKMSLSHSLEPQIFSPYSPMQRFLSRRKSGAKTFSLHVSIIYTTEFLCSAYKPIALTVTCRGDLPKYDLHFTLAIRWHIHMTNLSIKANYILRFLGKLKALH